MKVLLINGSPHERGCTYRALCEIEGVLHEEGVKTEIFQLGTAPVRGCTGCGACSKMKKNRCVYDDDAVNRVLEKCEEADGFIFGSPVHYASAGGSITSLMDRMFYCGSRVMRTKPAAAIVSARRAGTTAAIDQLNKYFTISGMPIASSQYWPMVHGSTPEQVEQDEEGLQIMRQLGRNLAWMMKSFAIAKEHGIEPPKPEAQRKWTNFVR
ncbi:MAG: flavodoxin family protein [Clostridiales bacterium]|nr:flavodoxin family protein [Clostridiales bacterium]